MARLLQSLPFIPGCKNFFKSEVLLFLLPKRLLPQVRGARVRASDVADVGDSVFPHDGEGFSGLGFLAVMHFLYKESFTVLTSNSRCGFRFSKPVAYQRGGDFERLNVVIAGERDDAEILHVSGDDAGFVDCSRPAEFGKSFQVCGFNRGAPVFYFERYVATAYIGNDVDFEPFLSSSPVGKCDASCVVTTEYMFEKSRFRCLAEKRGVIEQTYAFQKDSGGNGRVGKIDFMFSPEYFLPVAEWLQPVNQMRRFEDRYEAHGGRSFYLKILREFLHVEHASVVQAEIEEGLFKLDDPSDAEERGHIALEYFIDDIFAEEFLCKRNTAYRRGLREAAPQKVFVEKTGKDSCFGTRF